MAAALPRYMPEVVSETALALSCGGIHCAAGLHRSRQGLGKIAGPLMQAAG